MEYRLNENSHHSREQSKKYLLQISLNITKNPNRGLTSNGSKSYRTIGIIDTSVHPPKEDIKPNVELYLTGLSE